MAKFYPAKSILAADPDSVQNISNNIATFLTEGDVAIVNDGIATRCYNLIASTDPESSPDLLDSGVAGLMWQLVLPPVKAHASTHTDGTDDIQDATASQKGLMTAAQASKLADIEAGADVTDAQNVGAALNGAAAKTTPVDADTVALSDSGASGALKKLTWTNLKATLKSYFDAIYEPVFAKNTAFNKDFGTTAGTVCQGNDSRLSDARTPTAHKSTHASGGSDELTPSDIGAASDAHDHDSDYLKLENFHEVEVLRISHSGMATYGYKIFTNIPIGDYMCAVRIEGDLDSYTNSTLAMLSWYYYQGAPHQPRYFSISAQNKLTNLYVGVEDGKIVLYIDHPAYCTRLRLCFLSFPAYSPPAGSLDGWTWADEEMGEGYVKAEGGAAWHSAMLINIASKATPVDNDLLGLVDSADNNNPKKLLWSNLKAAIKSYLEGLSAINFSGSVSAGLKVVFIPTSGNLSVSDCKGCLLSTYGQTADNIQVLPTAAAGLHGHIVIGAAGAGAFRLAPASGDKIYYNGSWVGSDGGIEIETPAVGDNFDFYAFPDSDGSYNWIVNAGSQGTLSMLEYESVIASGDLHISTRDGEVMFFHDSIDFSSYAGTDAGSTPYKFVFTDDAGKQAVAYGGAAGGGEALGSEKIPQPLDFTSGWNTAAGGSIIDSDSFEVIGSDGGVTRGSVLQLGSILKFSISGSVTATLRVRNASNNIGRVDIPSGTFDTTFYSTMGSSSEVFYLSMSGAGNSADFTGLSIKLLTDVPVTGLHLMSTKNGTTRNMASVDSGFDPNKIVKVEIWED